MESIFTECIVDIISAIVIALAGYVGLVAKRLYNKYVNTEIKKSVATTVVKATEQIYKELHGDDKLNKAMEDAAAILLENGIKVSERELRILLESAVNEFNQVIVLEGEALTTE